MNRSTVSKASDLIALLLALLIGLSVAAQQQKPPNPQSPDPNWQNEQQPAATGQSSSPGTSNAQSSQGSSQLNSQSNGQGQISSQNEQTFIGRIVRSKDQFLLRDKKSNTNYRLDRQDLVKEYDGREVRVTGALDTSDNTIRVSTIEPLAR